MRSIFALSMLLSAPLPTALVLWLFFAFPISFVVAALPLFIIGQALRMYWEWQYADSPTQPSVTSATKQG